MQSMNISEYVTEEEYNRVKQALTADLERKRKVVVELKEGGEGEDHYYHLLNFTKVVDALMAWTSQPDRHAANEHDDALRLRQFNDNHAWNQLSMQAMSEGERRRHRWSNYAACASIGLVGTRANIEPAAEHAATYADAMMRQEAERFGP